MRFWITAWIAGELFSLFSGKEDIYINFIIPFGSLILIYSWFESKKIKSINQVILILILGILLSSLGFIWTEYLKSLKPQQELNQRFEGKSIRIQGYIEELPRQVEKGAQFVFQVTSWQADQLKLISSNEALIFPQRILLSYRYAGNKPELIPGDYWEFVVRLQKSRGIKNPYSFDVEQWLYIQDIESQGKIQASKARNLNLQHQSFRVKIERLRYYIRNKIQNTLGKQKQYAGVITALVIGDQSSIASDDWTIFSKTGIGHLISISGMHVTMLAGIASSLSLLLIKRTRLIYIQPAQYFAAVLGFVVAFLYTWIAGFQVPAQRTMMMVGISTLALYLGRVLHSFDIWFWALFLVLFINPWAIYAPGFWLSFGAVAAILYAMPKDHQNHGDTDLLFLKKLFTSLSEATRVQAVVTISLIPLTLFWFYQISLISPIANAIAIPVITFLVTPVAMLGAFLPSIVGELFLIISHEVFSWLMIFIKPLANLEYAIAYGAKPNAWQLLIALLGVLLAISPGPIVSNWKSRLIGFILCISLFIPKQYLMGQVPFGEIEMTVWDIGQGSAVLIKTRTHYLLFDTGPSSFGKFDPGEKIILPHLRAQGIKKIDQLVLSHQDADHVGGLAYLVRQFPIKGVMGSIPRNHPIQVNFTQNKLTFKACQEGQYWDWDGVHFRIWHPDLAGDEISQYTKYKPNEMSCVLEVRNQHHSIWLTGDIEKLAENLIVKRLKENPDQLKEIQKRHLILMAPHHGSKTSSSSQLLEILNPNEAFSQTGYQNRFRHPHQVVIDRYRDINIELLDTVSTGAQIWQTQSKDIFYKQFRD